MDGRHHTYRWCSLPCTEYWISGVFEKCWQYMIHIFMVANTNLIGWVTGVSPSNTTWCFLSWRSVGTEVCTYSLLLQNKCIVVFLWWLINKAMNFLSHSSDCTYPTVKCSENWKMIKLSWKTCWLMHFLAQFLADIFSCYCWNVKAIFWSCFSLTTPFKTIHLILVQKD
jgi:hypothetical protein